MNTATKRKPQGSDLLLPFEELIFPSKYLEYYKIRRKNFFASVQNLQAPWKQYMLLDEIWLREIDDLQKATNSERMFPLLLFFNAHAKLRLGIELAFSGCMAEARSLLRDAIEFVAHAHTMLNDPVLQKTWLGKGHGQLESEAFKDAFERNKKNGVFKGLQELYGAWADFSETGSHSNLNAIIDRLGVRKTANQVEYALRYTGGDPDLWEKSIFVLLQVCGAMESVFYRDYELRLNLDIELQHMRAQFRDLSAQISRDIVAKYNLKQPPAPTISKP